MRKSIVAALAAVMLLAGCDQMSPGQKGAVTGAAIGSGIGLVSGGSFGTVVGAGLIGGGLGYIVGSEVGR